MIIQEILTAPSNDPREELDSILAELCELVLSNQEKDSEYYGMVGACVLGPEGQKVCRTSYQDNKKYVHAERAAIEAYGDISPECIVVTTLSPCNSPMNDRAGESCEDVIASYNIEHVYCGYKDPTQKGDDSIETCNPKLRELCKRLADTFLDEARKKKRKSRGGGYFFPGYGYYGIGVGSSEGGGGDGGGGESKLGIAENFADGKVKGKSRPGRVKKSGASCSGSVTSLRKRAKNASGERARMYHWCANMKSGKKK
jgi:pyrimidine deaminase RibD-like protein